MQRKSKKKTAVLRCKIAAGTFGNEVYIVIELPEGEVLTGLADRSQVVLEKGQELEGNGSVEGGVKVSVLKRIAGKFLIDLPRETFSSGNRVLVPQDMVEWEAVA